MVGGVVFLSGGVGRQALIDITTHDFSLCHWDFPVELISLMSPDRRKVSSLYLLLSLTFGRASPESNAYYWSL